MICLDETCSNKYPAAVHARAEPSAEFRAATGNGRGRRKRRFDSPQQEAFLSLWRTYDRLRLLEDELFGRHDLTAQQYNALRLLRAARPQKVRTLTLGARLVSRAPDITRLVDRLAHRGLVERERPAENRRVVHVGITDAGCTLLEQLAGEVSACHGRQ